MIERVFTKDKMIEFAVEFADWIESQDYRSKGGYWENDDGGKSTKDLMKEFLTEDEND